MQVNYFYAGKLNIYYIAMYIGRHEFNLFPHTLIARQWHGTASKSFFFATVYVCICNKPAVIVLKHLRHYLLE